MKKVPLGFLVLLLFFPYLITQANEPNLSYYQIRYEIGCRDRDENDARCFWNKVEYIHAKETLDRSDIAEYLSTSELERITKKLRFLEARYETFCEEAEEPAYFCSALNKLVEKGQYFIENEQQYSHEGESNVTTRATVIEEVHESASESYECGSNTYNCSDFSSWSEAQSAYDYCLDETGYDVHSLDADNDGKACESFNQ